ncbi:unnamed protein product [Protopolystoma xenopodis]|uniref:Uncharacterized protein n=1 Tax=Protopolystoma xenopodis TaxID=117903 RepID=A0A448WNC8_9PLAT|nr:unnamed protein product [Protopolystoma xenopodis]
MHGYPRSNHQASLLNSAGLEPDRVLMLDIPHTTGSERLSGRAVDAVTGQRYHNLHDPPPTSQNPTSSEGSRSDDIRSNPRIVQAPDDRECEVGGRLACYAAHRDELIFFYGNTLQRIDADQDVHTVFEEVEARVVNPIPRRLIN